MTVEDPPAIPPLTKALRAARLVIVRQSSPQAHQDLHTLLERTLSLYPDIEGCEELGRLGIEPVRNPRPGDEFFGLPDGGSACLYQVEGTWMLLILGSAAARNAAGSVIDKKVENAVVNLMEHVLKTLRPVEVFIGPFDRVNRAHDFAPRTFHAFRDAGVKVLNLEDDPLEIWFDHENAEQTWYGLSGSAATNYKVTIKRTTSGRVSMARRNLWPFSEETTPVGLKRDDGRRLVVDERDQEAVRAIVAGLAANHTDAAIAQDLITQGLLRRRRRGKGLSHQTAASIQFENERTRVERAVRIFRDRMLDLAMGKHVMANGEPGSTNFTHRGVRREQTPSGGWQHILVWDVPDVFADVDERELDAALVVVARRLVRSGRRPSQWIHEHEQRERLRADLDALSSPQDANERSRRTQLEHELSRPIGSKPEHARGARVREIVELVLAETAKTNPRTSMPHGTRLFSGFPAWTQDDGYEYVLAAHLDRTYAFLRRTPDTTMGTAKSLNRAWGRGSGRQEAMRHVIAQVRVQTFHSALADAAARHIDAGVSVLSGQRAAASGIMRANQHLETQRSLRRQQLTQNLESARRDVRAAENRLRLLTESDLGGADSTGISDEDWQAVNQDALKEVMRTELQARARVKRLHEELDRLTEMAIVDTSEDLPDLDDLQLALQTLVALRTTVTSTSATARAVQALIPRLEIVSVTAFEATFEIDLLLPTPGEGSLPVGPIRFTVPTAGTRPVGFDSWSHAECEELTFRRLSMTDTKETRHGGTLKNGCLEPKSYVAYHAAQYLIGRGLRQGAARYLLQTTLLLPRIVAWHLVHGTPIDHNALGTSQEYVELIQRTYLDPNAEIPFKAPIMETRDELQRLHNAMRTAPTTAWWPSDIADHLGLPDEGDAKARNRRASTWATFKRQNLPQLLVRVGRKGVSVEGKKIKNMTAYVLEQCPHCSAARKSHAIDIVVWNAEVPGGRLCSACLRTPEPDSIEYPPAYRDLLDISPSSALPCT
jgi:hypothetical protein